MVSWLEGAYCKATMLLYVSVNYDVTTYVIVKIWHHCIFDCEAMMSLQIWP